MPATCRVVVSFGRNQDGDVVPLELREASSAAIGFSPTGNFNTGDFGDAQVITTFGEVDHSMPGG